MESGQKISQQRIGRKNGGKKLYDTIKYFFTFNIRML